MVLWLTIAFSRAIDFEKFAKGGLAREKKKSLSKALNVS